MEKHYPSNEWKYCQFCGSQEISWADGTHKMLCKTCRRSFFINAASAVIGLIKNDKGELLFTRRRNEPAAGKLDFPGGFVNLGERSEDALIREIKEELDLDLTAVKYYGSMPNRYLYNGIVYFTLDLIYFCEYSTLSGISANDDVSGFVFLKPEEVDLDELGLESVKQIVKNLKSK